jgi:TPR repeat protein
VEFAIWLANGRGGAADAKSAFAWMQRAARGGHVIARNRLAKMLALGVGTPVDKVGAATWHILARRDGLNDDFLDGVVRDLPKDELYRAAAAANAYPAPRRLR